jgi:ferredoxin-thioredoxin reductase catalytic subunit
MPVSTPKEDERPRIVERLRKMVQRWPSVSGYHLNPDPTVVEGVVQGLVRSVMAHGVPYCP